MTLLKKIISSQNLENAFNILCKQRKDYSAYDDIWDLRYNCLKYKQQIILQIKTSVFYFDPILTIQAKMIFFGHTITRMSKKPTSSVKII